MTNKKSEPDNLVNFFVGVGKGPWFFLKHTYNGVLTKKKTWTKEFTYFWAMYAVFASVITYAPKWNPPYIIYKLIPHPLPQWIAKWIYMNVPRHYQLLFVPIPFVLTFFALGVIEFRKKVKVEKAIRHLGLKTSTGLEPEVKEIVPLDGNKTKILVQAIGLDVAEFNARKGSLESSLNKIVQDVRVSPQSKQIFEIITAEKDLPRMIRFDAVSDMLSKPYTFLVGEANDGFITADLRELHHMLIAGSTGGGKSVFFKQALVGLLKSSEHIQLCLIDLKRGVEMRMFEALSNVHVAKNSSEAIHCLQVLEEEMNERFALLEKKGFTEIVPERDQLDRIVVGIDEASVLFTVERGSKNNKNEANDARELIDKLTKLGRAAGIHVILATQKVTKETIDTRVQTNIHAKICFRVNTVASSMTVLGNGKAAELPEIRGRAIWSVGSKDIEVQVPKLEHEEVKEEIEMLSRKFNNASPSNFQSILWGPKSTSRKAGGFHRNTPENHEKPT